MRIPSAQSHALLVVLASAAAAIALAVLAGASSAQTDPPASGDWTVGDTTLVKDTTVALDGNLLVTSTGRLTLENVTLLISEASNGEHGIEVASGGTLTIKDGDGQKATAGDNSRVSSDPTSLSYHFIVRSGSSLSITNALIEHCGYPGGTGNEQQGLFVATQDAVLTGVDVTACMYGLIVENGAVDARDSTFSNCTYQGVYATSSTVSLTGCTMGDDGYDGVRAIGGRTTIDRSSIFHCRYGAVARNTAVMKNDRYAYCRSAGRVSAARRISNPAPSAASPTASVQACCCARKTAATSASRMMRGREIMRRERRVSAGTSRRCDRRRD